MQVNIGMYIRTQKSHTQQFDIDQFFIEFYGHKEYLQSWERKKLEFLAAQES